MSEENKNTGALKRAIDDNHKEAKGHTEIRGRNVLERKINENRLKAGKSQLEPGFQSKTEEE